MDGMIIVPPFLKQTISTMKIQLIIATLGILSLPAGLSAQAVKKDNVKALEQQSEALNLQKSVNDRKLELAKLETEFQDRKKALEEASEKARVSADENKTAADKLTANAQDKKLANAAKSAARKAERDAKTARKEADNQEKLMAKITSLQKEIAEEETKLGGAANQTSGGAQGIAVAPAQESAERIAQPGNADTSIEVSAGGNEQKSQKEPLKIDNPVHVGQPGGQGRDLKSITEGVVESTYRNYPQQPGQPSIIINNIIIPSDYERQPRPKTNDSRVVEKEKPSDYEEYLAWKEQKNNHRAHRYTTESMEPEVNTYQTEGKRGKMSFQERFGEKQPRKSGMWVIPLVGVHASDFKADFSNDEAKGRTGWNAGLDFRMHTRRFFVQPGVHYFNSSLKMSDKDSLSSAPLLDGPRIHSLKVPVMLGLYLTKANKGFFKFNVKGGATGNYVIAVDKDSQRKFDKDNIEEFSYGLAAGVGLEFGLITLDLSHEWGMSPFLKSVDTKNNVLRATLGLKL